MITDESEKIELPEEKPARKSPNTPSRGSYLWLYLLLLIWGLRFVSGAITFIVGLTSYKPVVLVAGHGGQAAHNSLENGDRIRATDADLNFTTGLALDSRGNLYLTDLGNNRVLRVDRTGSLVQFAGTGGDGYDGDGGPAFMARFSHPYFLATDRAGNVYVSDAENNRVRKIDTQGVISTFAGTDRTTYSGENLPATKSGLKIPGGMTFDTAGNLYLADVEHNRIRKIDTRGVMTTVAGSGAAGFSGDGGPAVRAALLDPEAVQFDARGDLFISDTGNGRIRKVDRNGIITTVAGDVEPGFMGALHSMVRGSGRGTARYAELSQPYGLAFDVRGHLFVSDRARNQILEIDPDGSYRVILKRVNRPQLDFWNHMDEEHATHDVAQTLNEPKALAIDRDGNLYIADAGNNVIRKFPHAAAPGLYNGAPYLPR